MATKPSVEDVKKMTGTQLVEVYNGLVPDKPIKKFSDRETGLKRVLALLEGGGAAPARQPRAQQETGPLNLEAGKGEFEQYRPNTIRGRLIEAMSARGGATESELLALSEGKDVRWLHSMCRLINKQHGCAITQDGDRYLITEAPARRQRFAADPAKEIKPPREGTKRHMLVGLLSRANGASEDEIMEKLGLKSPVRVREALTLLNSQHGYGYNEDDKGRIHLAQ